MRKLFFPALIALMLCLPLSVKAKVDHLLPKVHSLTETKGTPFALHRAVTIIDANNTVALKEVFTDYGCTIEDGASATVTVEMVESIEGAYDYTLEGYDNEGYQLAVTENAIAIKAVKPIGVIRAAQTLAQLAEGYDEGGEAIETVEITDWAAFKLRGYMHDVGRSFISVDELKKHIELLSRFKVNTFHWHFTENQAWRFEVMDSDPAAEPDYTKLTSTESMTRFAGDYYTQAQCREVAVYAKERGVTIIPEIDMPGHSDAFERAMGYSMQTDEGVAVLKEVLTQLADVFPDAPYIHIGADEEAITYTKDGKGFLEIMAGHIRETLKRKMVVWNPISGVTINSIMTDMTQMWSSRGTDITGVPDIDCRYNYTNHFDVFADVVGIYKSNIYYADKGSEEIAGTISAYWNDRKTPTEEDIVKQNNMYANVLASAERAWIGGKVNGAEGYIEKLGTTLPNSGEVYEEFKDWETRFLFHKAHSLKDEPIPYVKQTNVRWRITDPFPNGGNSGATFAPDQYATSTDDEGLIPETFIHEGKTYYTGMATGAGIYLRHVWGNNTIPTYYGSTNHSNSTAYAWTYVYSPKAQTVGAQIEFQNYGRSEHDKTPYAGKWDRKGSDIWINGTRIDPPAWVNPNTDPTNEDDLQNENFTAREPIEVELREGWNKVFIKLPYVGADGVRLNKWMFTCVFTDLEGKNAVEDLIYSPNQCMDETTEAVAAKVSEIKRDRGALIGTAVGLWPESAAETLDSEIAAIEATYDEAKTAEERAAQVTVLEEAWTAFTASLTSDNMNQPVSGHYYRMYTPLRDNRYPTGKGAGSAVIGEQNPATKASIWQFVERNDDTYDIINLADGTYLSPASGNNSAINAVAEQPTAGWTVKRAATNGYVIITSTLNNAQLNQTNNSTLGYKVYNWGYNSSGFSSAYNTTDGGCQYNLIDLTGNIPISNAGEFTNGGIYTFVTSRGWMGATASSDNVISTARTTVDPAASASNAYFQWTVYKSNNGNYYLYNLGKQKFMGVQSSNNTSVPFAGSPAGKVLTFKQSSSADYPIMFSTDNAGVVNHSTAHGEGLITWTGGWNTLNDAGSNHKVTLVGALTEAALATIADLVEAYDKRLAITADVEGLEEENPNTHFGSARATSSAGAITTNLKRDAGVAYIDYDGTKETTIDFTRAYRGFEFQGYYVGGQSLGKSFTLTEALKSSITEENPLIAKFTTTDEATLFYDDDEFSYRIPAIATTSTGRIIAVSDYRHNLDDIGRDNHGTGTKRIDLVARTSDDNGKTWSETMTIAAGDNSQTGSYLRAFGDAAIAAVGENIVVMAAAGDVLYPSATAENPNRMARIFSSDNGANWSIEEMTTKMYAAESSLIPSGVAAFFGSGKLSVDADYNGTGKARIYGALLIKNASRTDNNYVVYSDDLGATWSILGGSQDPIAYADEPKVEILPSGQILLSARRQGGRVFNVFTYTDKSTNAGTWSTAVNGCNNGGSNGTNGEIFCMDAKKADGSAVKLLLQSQPKGGTGHYDRRDVTIWYKEVSSNTVTPTDIANNWIEGIQVSTQQSSYSTVAMQEDGKIAFFFEEAPCYDDNYTKGYSMVYIPLSVENITKGNYFSKDTDLDADQTVNVVLTDEQGNEYRDQITCALNGIAVAVTAKYPFITLGDNANLSLEGQEYTYTNSVTLPFKVSNAETTVWHNVYFPSAGSAAPVYLSANAQNGENVNTCVVNNVAYGNSTYNTADYASNISWAIYNVDNSFTFKFKNKLTGKYIQVTGVANGNDQNAVYVDEASATVFELVPDAASYNGDYALKATVGETVGYLCATSYSYGYATHYQGNGHQGAWVKFVEAPDFEVLIAEVSEVLGSLGDGLGKYTPAEADKGTLETAKTAMQNSGSVKLNELNTYKALLTGAVLNLPVAGQFFRVAYDYGGNVGKLYMQGVASIVKGVKFTAETGSASIWLYYDGALYSYAAGQCLREVDNDRGLQAVGGKTTATFSASTRVRGKYNIACTSYVHANVSGENYFTDHCSSNNCAAHDLILEEVTELPVAVGTAGYATLHAPVALTIPTGVKAYTGTLKGEWLTLNEVSTTIPANTAVILEGAANTYNFAMTDDVDAIEGNNLVGTIEAVAKTGTVYTLQSHDFDGDGVKEGIAFKQYTGTNLTGFKAYLAVESQVQAIRIRKGTTGIENSELNVENSAVIYDLLGRRVEKMEKGIYIVNGKKIIK